MSNLAKYGSYDASAAEEEFKDSTSSSGGKFYKCREGKNRLRFLPPSVGMRTPFVKVWQHFFTPVGAKKGIGFLCPRNMKAGYDCPACKKMDEWLVSRDPRDRERADGMRAKPRWFALVIDRDNEEKGIQVFGFGKSILKGLSDLRRDEDYGGDFTHPVEGMDIYIKRTGEGIDTRYTVHPGGKTTPLGNDHWLETMPDVRDNAVVLNEEDLEAKLRGEKPTRREDFQDGPKLGRGRSRSSASQTSVEEFGDDDYPEDV